MKQPSVKKVIDMELTEILGLARSIHFAMLHGAISKEQARKRIDPLLTRLNRVGKRIAKKYKMPYRKITFANLGENL